MRKKLAVLLACVMVFSMFLTACGNSSEETKEKKQTETASEDEYHVAIVTPTLSVSEDEFRAGQQLEEQYPDIVQHLVLPEKFDTEIEGCISTIVSAADDPLMKAVVVISGQSGLIPAFQQIKEKNYALRFRGKIGENIKYSGRILAVGISYGKAEKKHSCRVEVL